MLRFYLSHLNSKSTAQYNCNISQLFHCCLLFEIFTSNDTLLVRNLSFYTRKPYVFQSTNDCIFRDVYLIKKKC